MISASDTGVSGNNRDKMVIIIFWRKKTELCEIGLDRLGVNCAEVCEWWGRFRGSTELLKLSEYILCSPYVGGM
jgi:hypothetical protein